MKTALRDLTKVGLIEKAPQPHGKANRLYVKVIPDAHAGKRKRSAGQGIRDYSYEGEDSL